MTAATMGRAPIVLIHGAWHGAWAWDRLIPHLGAAGHPVCALDLGGLGAKAHRQAPGIGLHVHGQDVIQHLSFHDLRDAIIVGHSYGGCVLSEALAQDTDDRIAHAIYLDAFLLGAGEALADHVPPEVAASFRAAADAGAMIPPRPAAEWADLWGLTGNDAAFAGPRLRPMPARCFTEAVQGDLNRRTIRRSYLRCTQNPNPVFDRFSARARTDPRFANGTIDGHHDVMLIDPATLAAGLLTTIRGDTP